MLFPTQKAMQKAGELQYGAFSEGTESETLADERAVAVATVHTRQDLVLVYSMLTDCHRQLVTISRGVWVLAALTLALLLR